MPLTDEELIDLFLQDDEKAQRLFVEKYRPWVLGVAKKQYKLDAFAAEEVFQNVLLTVLENDCRVLRNWQKKSKFSTYLTVIVCRISAQFKKRNNRPDRAPESTLDNLTSEQNHADEDIHQNHRLQLIKTHFEQLSGRDQLLLTYRFLEEKEPKEIAQILNMKPATVRKGIHDALARLRNKLPFDVTLMVLTAHMKLIL